MNEAQPTFFIESWEDGNRISTREKVQFYDEPEDAMLFFDEECERLKGLLSRSMEQSPQIPPNPLVVRLLDSSEIEVMREIIR